MNDLLASKLRLPPVPNHSIARPRLIQALQNGLAQGRRLTLISAPAGYGKTTCVRQWLEQAADWTPAWFALDAEDDDPTRFFAYLRAALPGDAFRAAPGVAEPQAQVGGLPAEQVVRALHEAFPPGGGRCILVLDDFQHVTDPAILRVCERWIAYLPQTLHLVLVTREDPPLALARLRANDQLTEIRADDLRFTRPEIIQYLSQRLGVDLPAEEIATLQEHTEGWIAGLQLSSLTLANAADRAGVLARLAASRRHILGYLTEEVLSQQPEAVQSFLIETAILDRLSPELCDWVTQRDDSAARLEQLWRANLFLVPVDPEQRWFRYHRLFADLLRSRLSSTRTPPSIASLHRRAHAWYAQACASSAAADRVVYGTAAVQHAIAGGDVPAAEAVIAAYAEDLLSHWYLKTFANWLQALPRGRRQPATLLAEANLHLARGETDQAADCLEAIDPVEPGLDPPAIEQPGTHATRVTVYCLRSAIALDQGRPDQALELGQQARRAAAGTSLDQRTRAVLAVGAAYQALNQLDAADELYRELIRAGAAEGDPNTELVGISVLGLQLIQTGQLHAAERLVRAALERLQGWPALSPIATALYGELGTILASWGQIDQAEEQLLHGAQINHGVGFSDGDIYLHVFRSQTALLRNDLPAAALSIQRALQTMRADAPAVVRSEVIAQQVQVLLAQDQIAQAEDVLKQEYARMFKTTNLAAWPVTDLLPFSLSSLVLSAVRVLLARARQAPAGPAAALADVVDLCDRVQEHFLARRYLPLAIETTLLRAQAWESQGQAQRRDQDLQAALDMAQAERIVLPFLAAGAPVIEAAAAVRGDRRATSPRADFIDQILRLHRELIGAPAAAAPGQDWPALPEPLTSREREVLRQISAGDSYAAIAERLVISINTVRSHVKAIYGKLGVNNRVAALEAARRLQLL